MRRLTTAAAACAALALTISIANADSGQLEGGIFLGGGLVSSDNELGNAYYDDQIPVSSVLFGLRAGYHLIDNLLLEGEFKLAPTSTKGDDAAGRGSHSATILGWRLQGSYQFWGSGPVSVFGLAGLGGETFLADAPAAAGLSDPDTDALLYWGAGAKYRLGTGNYGARLDLRQGVTAGRDGAAIAHEVHLGMFFTFGGSAAPAPAPVVATPEPTAPTPTITDSDGDGFADDVDKCPTSGEIINGIDDEDGCPEIDSDNDGLLGTRDSCPDAAEDVDGHEDTDGCPDPDNDADGRPDVMDACPMEAENLNGYQDDDGCPDTVPERIQEFTGVIQGILFRRGSARIMRKSRGTLDKAVALFKEYETLRIEVSGHTDNTGSQEANMSLSRKRADYVKWYLVDKGIDADRILTVGHGPTKPLETNETAAGRAVNRRIEFRLLPGPTAIEVGPDGAPVGPSNPKPAPE